MPVDPNIPLQAGQNIPQFGPNPAALLNQQVTAANLAKFGQQQEGRNALRQFYTDPANLDASGQPTPQAMQRLMAAAPETGLDLRQALTQDATAQAQLAMARAREGETVIAEKFRVAQEAQATYTDALKTMTPDAARRAAQDVWTRGRDELSKSGIAGPDVMQTMPPNYDPVRVGRSVAAWQQASMTPLQQQQLTGEKVRLGLDVGKATTAQFDEPKNIEYTDPSGKKQSGVATYDKVARNWVLDDGTVVKPSTILGTKSNANPKAEAFAAYMQAHPDATPEQQAQFIQASGAAARSGPAAAVRKYMEENPNATADQIAEFTAKVSRETRATAAFGTGQQGNQVRSLNVVANHLDTVSQLGDALQNGDVRTVNKLRNTLKTEFGYEGPVDFNVAKQIVGDEVVKAVIGSGAGGVTDRAALQENFNAANTPAQLNGVVKTAKQLIAGQYEGLRQQYEQSTGLANFDELLSPGAKKMLGEGGKPTEQAEGSAAAGPQNVGGVPTYSSPEQLKAHPPTGYWRRPDDPPGQVRPP